MHTSSRLTTIVDRAPAAAEIAQIRAGLTAFNDAQAGSPATVELFAVYLRDAHDVIHGGLVGFLAWQWLSIEWLWVEESQRGLGYGSELLHRAETLARGAGCVGVKLDTYEFQARPFYEKTGYVVFGILEGYPAGTRTYYMRKSL
ncbi:GNAT family N-acetyltransferase [soil metagenome]